MQEGMRKLEGVKVKEKGKRKVWGGMRKGERALNCKRGRAPVTRAADGEDK